MVKICTPLKLEPRPTMEPLNAGTLGPGQGSTKIASRGGQWYEVV